MRAIDDKRVEGFDLLMPRVGELIGGSIREERYDELIRCMVDKKMKLENYEWYTDLRKYGTVPHGGFGLGFERFIQLVTGMRNIRDTIPIPRSYEECKF
jgi:asparaginyl-tRNA synthetase